MLNTNGVFELQAKDNSSNAGIIFSDGSTGNYGLIDYLSTDNMLFYTASSERMRIDSSGNVGIGTSTTSNKLDVDAGTGAVGIALFKTGDATSANNAGGGFAATSSATAGDRRAQMWLDADGANFGNNDYFYINKYGNNGIVELYQASSAAMTFRTGGTERMRITSAGEVLVGGTVGVHSAPGSLVIERANAATFLSFVRNDTTISSGDSFGSIEFYGTDTTGNANTLHAFIRANASGTHAAGDNPTDLVFGCTNDGSSTVAEFARIEQGGASTRNFRLQQPTLANGEQAIYYAYGGTAGTLNRIGAVGVYKHAGITNVCAFVELETEDAVSNYLWADNSDVLRISTTKDHIGTTSGTVVGAQTSDERIKNVIGPVTYGLEQIKAIEPVEYTLKSDTNTKKIGFIAQQVLPLVPESVFDTGEVIEGEPEDAPTKLGMEYVALIPVLVNAVKELSAELNSVKAELATLKGN
jgi:hypothetical protein